MLDKVQHQHHDYLELQLVLPPLHYYLTAEAENCSTLCSHIRRRRALIDKIDGMFLRIICSKNRGHVGGGRHEVRAECDVIQIY
jgi:hypothetical protein